MKAKPNLLKPNNDQYTQHLKLSDKQLAELKQYGQESAKFLKAFFSNRNHQEMKK